MVKEFLIYFPNLVIAAAPIRGHGADLSAVRLFQENFKADRPFMTPGLSDGSSISCLE